MALVPRIVDVVNVPVIAAGGIADGRGIAAALMLGAAGVQIGTAFLATPECQSHDVHKSAVIAATGDDTMHTAAFSGRAARTITNPYAREMAKVIDWPDFSAVERGHRTHPRRHRQRRQWRRFRIMGRTSCWIGPPRNHLGSD